MRFKAHAVMAGNPELDLRIQGRPLDFEISADGSFKIAIGRIQARIGEIPIRLRIPFLRRRCAPIAIGSIGGFAISISPAEAELRPFGVRVSGVLGKEGIACNLQGKVGCRTTFDASGEIPGKITRVAFDVEDEKGKAEEET